MTPYQTRLVTVSASYGAGGSVVAPALAERLGVPFLQRATTTAGGIQGPGPCAERLVPEEAELTPPHRIFAALIQSAPAGPRSRRRPRTTWTGSCASSARRASATWWPTGRA